MAGSTSLEWLQNTGWKELFEGLEEEVSILSKNHTVMVWFIACHGEGFLRGVRGSECGGMVAHETRIVLGDTAHSLGPVCGGKPLEGLSGGDDVACGRERTLAAMQWEMTTGSRNRSKATPGHAISFIQPFTPAINHSLTIHLSVLLTNKSSTYLFDR